MVAAGVRSSISRIAVHKWLRKFEEFRVQPSGAVLGIRVRQAEDQGEAHEVRLIRCQRERRRVRYWPTPELLACVAAWDLKGEGGRISPRPPGVLASPATI